MADPQEIENPLYRAVGPSGSVLKQVQGGNIPIGNIVEDMARRSPQAAIANFVANQPFLRSFAKSGGVVTEPLAAALSAVAEKPLQWAGRVPERPISAAYHDYRGKQQDQTDEMRAEHPGQSILGDVLGVVAPGTVFSRAYGLMNKATAPVAKFGEKLMEGGIPTKISGFMTKYAVRPFLRGGAAQLGYEAVNPESRIYSDPNYAKNAFLLGGAGDTAATMGGKGIEEGWNLAKIGGNYLVRMAKKTPVVGEYLDEFSKIKGEKAAEAFKKGAGELGDKIGTGSVDDAFAQGGEGFQQGVTDARDKLFDNYKKVRDPIMKKFGGSPASLKNLREHIANALDEAGALDAKGNINLDSPVFAGPNAGDYKMLAKYSQSLQQNPSMAELDTLIKGFGNRANFGARERSAMERIYGKLYGGARDDLLDSAESLVTQLHKGGPEYRAATKNLDNSLALADEYAGQMKEPLTGERMKAVLQEGKEGASKKVAAAQEKLAGMNQAAQDSGELTAELIRQARKDFAAGRNVLEPLEKISGKAPEKIVAGARANLPGSQVTEMVKTLPELRQPIGKAVMANILSKAKDPATLTKAIDAFGREHLTNLFGPEVMGTLEHLETAGSQPGFIGKTGNAIKNWAVRNPQARGWVPRLMLNEAQPVNQEENQ